MTARPELPERPHTLDWSAVQRWRMQVRQALIGSRLLLDGELRRTQGEQIKRRLLESAQLSRYQTLAIYWPVRGEVDVRDVAIGHLAGGGRVALPVVVRRSAPVEFWSWRPDMPMSRDLCNIPVPGERSVLVPDALLVPLVGFDGQRYRLGYGAGYYDRTLAVAEPRPFCIGLGYEAARLESIFPQPHDIAMDVIVTGNGSSVRGT